VRGPSIGYSSGCSRVFGKAPCSKVRELFGRKHLAVLVQRLPGRQGVPEVREIAYLRALEATRTAVGTGAHQRQATAMKAEGYAVHVSDRNVAVGVDLLWKDLPSGQRQDACGEVRAQVGLPGRPGSLVLPDSRCLPAGGPRRLGLPEAHAGVELLLHRCSPFKGRCFTDQASAGCGGDTTSSCCIRPVMSNWPRNSTILPPAMR
jgi:hypothetical protein